MARTAPQTGPGNYMRGVLKLVADLEPGSMNVVTILHDDWCGYWSARPCDCSPEFTVRPEKAP